MPEIDGMYEADITINGRRLTFAESMVVRCAVTSMRMSMNAPAARKAIGIRLADGYDYYLDRVEDLIVKGIRQKR